MTTKRNYGRLAFWGVVALLTVTTLASAIQLRQWACEPYMTLPTPARFVPRVEPNPCGNGQAFVYPAKIQTAYRLTK